MNGNAKVISALIRELDLMEVREFCVCAGARNAPIIDALVQRGAHMRHFFDERSAAFFALGRVMQTRRPAVVLTTSGTAAAELFPAIIEAHYQNVPLVAVTADRPSSFAGSGAPQAIEQRGIFGKYASRFVEIECIADGRIQMTGAGRQPQGPAHFNVRLEEGLDDPSAAPNRSTEIRSSSGFEWGMSDAFDRRIWQEFWEADGDLVVLAGGLHPADVPASRMLLSRIQAPIVAEATANLHAEESLNPWMVRGGEKLLQSAPFKRVLRLGSVPSWRWWRDLESREDVRVLGISRAPFRGLARLNGVSVLPWNAIESADVLPSSTDNCAVDCASRLAELLDEHANSEPAWMRQLSRIIGPGATVLLGNSLPIREWNLAAEPAKPGTVFFGNRGANGIDGLVSTWLGTSADAGEAWLIAGDLSALYDMNAPWILSQLPAAKRRIVIINNGGGGIFSHVRWLDALSPEAKRIMANPHTINFEPWARMWGMEYRLLTDWKQLDDDDQSANCGVWEIQPDTAATDAFWSAWRS